MTDMQFRVLLPANFVAPALVLTAPLSLPDGLSAKDGRIVQAGHPQMGDRVVGRVLVAPQLVGTVDAGFVISRMRDGVFPAGLIVVGGVSTAIISGAVMAERQNRMKLGIASTQMDTIQRIKTNDFVHFETSHVWVEPYQGPDT